MKRSVWAVAIFVLASQPRLGTAQNVGWTAPVGNMLGKHATPQTDKNLWGTDLGMPAITGSGLSLAFGDSWKDTNATPIGPNGNDFADDTTGFISTASPGWSTGNPTGGFPDGAAVERWIAEQQRLNGTGNMWNTKGPPMTFMYETVNGAKHVLRSKLYALNTAGTAVVNLPGYTLVQDGVDGGGNPLYRYKTALGDTPSSAWGTPFNGEHRYWATFMRHEIHYATASTPCGTGYTVNTNMGTCGGTWSSDWSDPVGVPTTRGIPCVGIGNLGGDCADPLDLFRACQYPIERGGTQPITGLCLDTTSPFYDSTDDGRILSVVLRQLVGYQDSSTQRYLTQAYNTNKLISPAAFAVQNFSPTRAYDSASNVYTLASSSSANNRIFFWGRPNYIGYGKGFDGLATPGSSASRSPKLYFAYSNVPTAASFSSTAWTPRYFVGFSALNTACPASPTLANTSAAPGPTGTYYPCFSTNSANARPLDLTSGLTDKTYETLDIVMQMSVAWVPQLGKFMMVYGGDAADTFLALSGGPAWRNIRRNTNGAIYARFARFPWGPWTAPKALFDTGNVVRDLFGNTTSATGGIYAGTNVLSGQNGMGYTFNTSLSGTFPPCNPAQVSCLTTEGFYGLMSNADKIGRLYGASIIPTWIKNGTAADNAHVFWLASTWNPYQVVLMKSLITP